jgi:hypothetical protein
MMLALCVCVCVDVFYVLVGGPVEMPSVVWLFPVVDSLRRF